MTVTKVGKPKDERDWKGTCHQCDSEAIAKESELTHITQDHKDGGRFSWEVCPVCEKGNPDTGMAACCFTLWDKATFGTNFFRRDQNHEYYRTNQARS